MVPLYLLAGTVWSGVCGVGMEARRSWELMGTSFPSCPGVVLTNVARINCCLLSRLSYRVAATHYGRYNMSQKLRPRVKVGVGGLWRTRRLAFSPQSRTWSNAVHVLPACTDVHVGKHPLK